MASHCVARTATGVVCSKGAAVSAAVSSSVLPHSSSLQRSSTRSVVLAARHASSSSDASSGATSSLQGQGDDDRSSSSSSQQYSSLGGFRTFNTIRHATNNSRFNIATTATRTSSHAYSTVARPFLTLSFGDGQQRQSSASLLSTIRAFSSSSGKRDFYDVLGVDRNADKGAVKKAYFKLAKQYHPDTNQGDDKAAEKFKEVTEAYEVLSDDKQREMYNQFGHAGVDPNFAGAAGGPGGPGGSPFGGAGGFNFQDGSFHFSSSSSGGMGGNPEIDPEELFDMFFGAGGGGGRRRARGPRRGADLQMHVRLTFKEAVFGASKDLNLRYQHQNRQTGEVSVKEREVTVDVPAGVDNGMNLRLSGQGAEGDPGAQPGNLLVQLIVDQDDFFERDGYDVHCEVPISLTQAVLGGTVDVQTLDSTVEMKIPRGSQPDTKLMLRGKGIQQLHGSTKGNQIVHLKIVIPKEITVRQEELLREFDEETAQYGSGISGRLAKAAGSAFEKLFGTKKQGDGDKKKSTSSSSSTSSSTSSPGDDSEDDEKKQAAS